jgi:tripartite-type tricarboxylate transporter receptor subunit TctC
MAIVKTSLVDRTNPLRRAVVLGSAGAAFGLPRMARSQAYPSHPVQLVVPVGAGGINDTISRVVAQKLGESLGQPFVVVNKPGASGIIGSELVAKSPPDGQTLLMVYASHALNPSLYTKLPYDTLRDFTPVVMVNLVELVLTVPPTGAASVAQLIAQGKASTGKISCGIVGQGSLGHLAAARFAQETGLELLYVPFKSAPEVTSALIRGDVSMFFDAPASALAFIKSGRVRPLGVASPRRTFALPDVPTIEEAGVKGFEVVGWNGLVAPAGTPAAIIEKLNAEVVKALNTPEVRNNLRMQGVEPVGDTPEHFAQIIRRDIAKWGEVVRKAGIKIE